MAEAHAKSHPYHLVPMSPWPLIGSIGGFLLALGAIQYMHEGTIGRFAPGLWWTVPGFAIVILTMVGWWGDVLRESKQGDHTPVVQLHLRYGMILFIASEVMFFFAWFWAFFEVALNPDDAAQVARAAFTGGTWPPQGVEVFDPWHLPLINTLILLLSGTTVTWAHHALLENDRKGLIWGLALTVGLGAIFTCVQAYEYMHASFSFGGSIFGATFFMATGFHGFHVIVGTIFLAVCLVRAIRGDFTPQHHFGFEAAAWYWHFVDVVWLFLFTFVYVWGSAGATIAGH